MPGCPAGFDKAVTDAVITKKANACPMAIRLAWHASGTYAAKDNSGGSNGATMRFAKEAGDDANAGLSIARDMLLPVPGQFPGMSVSDTWTFAGAQAVKMMGGPEIEHGFGRVDAASEASCPDNGRLPDASQGAEHLRDVFYRMGFDDREIVALSGAHTVGRCHLARSGYDGPWTRTPLQFNNEYFRNLIDLEWKESDRTGNAEKTQFEDVATGKLMMLPTDMALKTDPKFRPFAELYARDQDAFFADFAKAFAKLLALGGPASVQPTGKGLADSQQRAKNAEFREQAMHGSLAEVKRLAGSVDANEVEEGSGRTALHKAAFWGHVHLMPILIDQCKIGIDVQDYNGDTALHDAARFGHASVVSKLLESGANASITNASGQTAAAVATAYNKPDIAAMLSKSAL
jgi:hypothetical protein